MKNAWVDYIKYDREPSLMWAIEVVCSASNSDHDLSYIVNRAKALLSLVKKELEKENGTQSKDT